MGAPRKGYMFSKLAIFYHHSSPNIKPFAPVLHHDYRYFSKNWSTGNMGWWSSGALKIVVFGVKMATKDDFCQSVVAMLERYGEGIFEALLL